MMALSEVRVSCAVLGLVSAMVTTQLGCETTTKETHACPVIFCNRGVTLSFDALFSENVYQLEIAVVTTTPEIVPIATCTLNYAWQNAPLECASTLEHAEFSRSVRLIDTTYQRLQVTFSTNGAVVGQQTADVVYAQNPVTCEECKEASIHMTIR